MANSTASVCAGAARSARQHCQNEHAQRSDRGCRDGGHTAEIQVEDIDSPRISEGRFSACEYVIPP